MPTLVSLNGNIAFKGGTTAKNNTYTGPARTISIDTERNELRIHDGTTAGGIVANSNLATTTANGWLSSSDKVKLDGLNKGVANGVASLDATGKVPSAQLPAGLTGGLNYQGTWNASTNTPAIPTASTSNNGWYYKVATAGATNIGGVTDWQIGDWVISNGSSWDKIDNTEDTTLASTTVNGLMSAADKTKLNGIATGAAAVGSTAGSNIAATGAVGTSTTAARSDHTHAHGNQAGGTLHSEATTAVAGFLSPTDKVKINNMAPVGGGTDRVFYEDGQTINSNYTITAGRNAMSVGPITIATGIIVEIPTGSVWSLV
jgi:hypothetical protein